MRKILLGSLMFLSLVCNAQDQILVISGGDEPGLNHYSQYLQTKTIYDYLLAHHGKAAVNIYFGAGNNLSTVAPLLDVHKIINTVANKHDKTDTMLAGIMPNNQAATKTNVTTYFLSPTAQNINSNQNFLLFVSDHGMPYQFLDDKNANPYENNCIDLWHYDKKFVNNFTSATNFYQACLSKNELSSLLSQIKANHTIFAMSQCFSGGFHQLSVNETDGYPTANPKVCGFTATAPDHGASGCTADADGASYQGYERSFTEWYTGQNVVTGQKLRSPATSMFTAHQHAALEDMTQDVPLSTSDYYLLKWADLFNSDKFISRVPKYNAAAIKNIYQNYTQYRTGIKNPDFLEFYQFAQSSQTKIAGLFPNNDKFFDLSLLEQAKAIDKMEQNIEQQSKQVDIAWDGIMNVYLNLVMPTWESAVNAHQIKTLTDKQYTFEKDFYQKIVADGLFKYPYQFDMYFLQYLSMKNNDPDLISYQKNRYQLIQEWALKNNNQTLINAVQYLEALDKKQQALRDNIEIIEKNKQLHKRIFTYNKVIAAWITLVTVDDKVALNDLEALLSCEHQHG